MKQSVGIFICCLLLSVVQGGVAQAQDKTFTNSFGLEFVLIPMGRLPPLTWTTKNDFGEDVQHQRVVTITNPFYLGKCEVTQEQWVAVMGEGSNESRNEGRTNPVENVSWDDAQKFIQKLNEKEGVKQYRLPTEGEWEHAARAGSETEWFFGTDEKALDQYAWCPAKSTHPVGQKEPNPWGLYDIYGNVWEWVEDRYGEFKAEVVTDPKGPSEGSGRVLRGGSWGSRAEDCRSAYRFGNLPDRRYDGVGFRLAFSPGE